MLDDVDSQGLRGRTRDSVLGWSFSFEQVNVEGAHRTNLVPRDDYCTAFVHVRASSGGTGSKGLGSTRNGI